MREGGMIWNTSPLLLSVSTTKAPGQEAGQVNLTRRKRAVLTVSACRETPRTVLDSAGQRRGSRSVPRGAQQRPGGGQRTHLELT